MLLMLIALLYYECCLYLVNLKEYILIIFKTGLHCVCACVHGVGGDDDTRRRFSSVADPAAFFLSCRQTTKGGN